MAELKRRGYNATGTIRVNRIPKQCKMKTVEEMKKSPRGSYSVAQATCNGDSVTLVRWKDNSVVTTGSTIYGSHPVGPVGRYSKDAGGRIQVQRPHAIRKYNESMGGTDRQDQHVNNYRTTMRGKKWWFPVFTWLVDVSAQNAWRIGHHAGARNCDTFLEFRHYIVNYYLMHYGIQRKSSGRKVVFAPGVDEVRFDRQDHFVARNNNNSRRRCAQCGSRSVYGCVKCDKGLCPECFSTYHTQE